MSQDWAMRRQVIHLLAPKAQPRSKLEKRGKAPYLFVQRHFMSYLLEQRFLCIWSGRRCRIMCSRIFLGKWLYIANPG